MGFNSAPGSERVDDIDKAHAMANAGKEHREKLAFIKESRIKNPDNPGPFSIEHYEEKADIFEEMAGREYVEGKYKKMDDAELEEALKIIKSEQELRRLTRLSDEIKNKLS